MNSLYIIKKTLEKALEGVVITIMLLLVMTVLWQVISRYVMGAPSSWSEEFAKILLVWGSLLGSAIAYSEKSHLGVDYFVEKLNFRNQSLVAFIVHLLVGGTASYLMIYGRILVMQNAFVFHQTTAALKLCWGYIYLALPVTGIFFVIFSIEFMMKDLTELKQGCREEEDHG